MTLRLPLAMAAQQGPCPNCDRELVAPDPYHGIGAFLAPLPPTPPVPEPFSLFVESPPLVPRHVEEELMREQLNEPTPAPPVYPPDPFPAYQPEPFPVHTPEPPSPYQTDPGFPMPEPAFPFSEPEPPAPEPFSSPPLQPATASPAPQPQAPAVVSGQSPDRMVLLLSCMATGLVTLIVGIFLGV
ncbi:MAG: hypothetical protein EOP87_26935, partial [Verrucomicrobiaceae bacterium]